MDNQEGAQDIYKVTRGQIEHVNNILSQRVIWMVIAQSFFFSAFGVLVTGNPNNPMLQDLQHILLRVLPIASMFTVIFTYIDIISQLLYLRALRNYSKTNLTIDTPLVYPPVMGFKQYKVFENASPFLLPPLFITTWIIILTR